MVKRNGLILKWGFCLLLLVLTLSMAVCGAEQKPQNSFDTKLVNNFEVFDADIRDAFRGLAEYGGFNLLMDKKVDGNVTIKFQSGITTKEAIDVLARTNGYTCYWMTEQNTVVVGDEKTYQNLDTIYTRVYTLKYADPEAVADTLKVIVPKERLGVDKRTNQVVVRGNILEQENVRDAVAGMDREMPQISIEMRIEETTREALDKLGIGWGDGDFGLGLKENLKITKIVNNVASVNLNLWESQTNAKILAKPMIATTDSKEAAIFIGDKVPVISKTVDDDQITYTVNYIDVGTKLAVTPRINDSDIVTVNVKATLSNVTGYTTVGTGVESYKVPDVRNREVGSVIRLRDGETFMLSGLNQSESIITKNALKGLNKIPLIGKLFQNTTKEDPASGTEIVIFITPRIVRMSSNNVQAPQTEAAAPAQSEKKAEPAIENNEAVNSEELQPVGNTEAVVAAPLDNEEEVDIIADLAAEEDSQPAAEETDTVEAAQVDDTEEVDIIADLAAEEAAEGNEAVTDTDTQAPESAPAEETKPDTSATESAPANLEEKQVVNEQTSSNLKFDGQHLTVTVKPNQSVAQLAALYGVSCESILKDNNLVESAPLNPGQEVVITIPSDHLYYLAPKETMWRISKRYNISLDVLKEINQLDDLTKVEKGQVVILPVSTKAIFAGNF